jgi:hypothetical protein
MLHAIAAIFFVEVNNRFGVTVRAIAVSPRDQLFTQSKVVVDLAVKDKPDGSVFIADGLVSGCEVDNTEAAYPKTDRPLDKGALIIWTAVCHDIAHPAQDEGIRSHIHTEFQNACDTAHRPVYPKALPAFLDYWIRAHEFAGQ